MANQPQTVTLPLGVLPPHPVRWVLWTGNNFQNVWVRKNTSTFKRLQKRGEV